ncbi:hypothetical protein ACFVH6_20160 [Spirillospora sp. NPDC127200]
MDRTLVCARPAKDDTVVAMDPRARARAWSVRLSSGLGFQNLCGPDNGLLGRLAGG